MCERRCDGWRWWMRMVAMLAKDLDLMQVKRIVCGWDGMRNAGNEKFPEGVILEIRPS